MMNYPPMDGAARQTSPILIAGDTNRYVSHRETGVEARVDAIIDEQGLRGKRVRQQYVEGGGRGTVHGAITEKRRGASMTRMAGRRSSSIGCRSLIGRRASVYISNSYDPVKLILEINGQVALFRDLLIHIGQAKDCPELREKIRKLRRSCVEACKHTSQLILPQLRSSAAEGIPEDNPHLVLLFFISQLFLRELTKCHRLVQIIPMDMSGYYENRAGPSNLGNVISQILLCKQITPDFNQEELCSISKDSQEISRILKEMQEYMPKQENNLEKSVALTEDLANQWNSKPRRNSLYKNMGLLCCVRRPNYL